MPFAAGIRWAWIKPVGKARRLIIRAFLKEFCTIHFRFDRWCCSSQVCSYRQPSLKLNCACCGINFKSKLRVLSCLNSPHPISTRVQETENYVTHMPPVTAAYIKKKHLFKHFVPLPLSMLLVSSLQLHNL